MHDTELLNGVKFLKHYVVLLQFSVSALIVTLDTKISVSVKKGAVNCLLIVILAMISITQQNIPFYLLSTEALEHVLDENDF